MKIPFRQKSIGWCTVYTLANIFNDKGFLKYLEDDRFKGCSKEDVEYMLADQNTGLKIADVIYVNQHYQHLPKQFVYDCLYNHKEDIVFDKPTAIPVIPYMLTVRLIESIYHSVAVLMISGEMYYIDPYREKVIKIESFNQFSELFIDCVQVERFYRPTDESFIILDGEMLGFNTLIEEQIA
jgi:hypothetical protein